MSNRITSAARKSTRPLQVASVSSLVFLSGGFLSYGNNVRQLSDHLLITGFFFLCMWIACRLFSEGMQRRLKLEGITPANRYWLSPPMGHRDISQRDKNVSGL